MPRDPLDSFNAFPAFVLTALGGIASLMAALALLGGVLKFGPAAVEPIEGTIVARSYVGDKVRLQIEYETDGTALRQEADLSAREGVPVDVGDPIAVYVGPADGARMKLKAAPDWRQVFAWSALASLLLVPGVMLLRRHTWRARQIASGAARQRRTIAEGRPGAAWSAMFEKVRLTRAWIYIIPLGALLFVGSTYFAAQWAISRPYVETVRGSVLSAQKRPTVYGFRDTVIYGFEFRGRRYGDAFEDHDDGRWRAGAAIDIEIDTRDPERNRVADTNSIWVELMFGLFGLAMLLLGLTVIAPFERFLLRRMGYVPK